MEHLFRDRWDKKIAGVCGGLGRFFKLDPTILRLTFVFFCIFTGILPCIILYLIAWMIIPNGPLTYITFPCKKLYRSVKNQKIAGICSGIAEFIGCDPVIVRIIILVILIMTAFVPIFLTYIVGILIIPVNSKERYTH